MTDTQAEMQQIADCNRMGESQYEGAFLAIPRYEEFMLPMLRLLADGQIQHVSASGRGPIVFDWRTDIINREPSARLELR